MIPTLVLSIVGFAIAGFLIQRTGRRAAEPAKWTRNGFLGVATIATLLMAAIIRTNGVVAFSILVAWFPGMVLGILLERWQFAKGPKG